MSTVTKDVIHVTGISKKQYTFEVYQKHLSWNSVAGVYLILRKNQNGNYLPIYVGETENLGERFQDHHKMACFEKNGWTNLGFLHEKNEHNRLAIEQDILKNFNWICNN